jgi:SagB-type dehydrogenase family enzyme
LTKNNSRHLLILIIEVLFLIETIGADFHRITKYVRGKMLGGYLDWANKPDTYKEYLDTKKVELPLPKNITTLSFNETIRNRKSIRRFSDKALNLKQLGYLLWSSTGIQRVDRNYAFRNAPSAGALYPIETYLFAKNIQGLEMGMYHYNIKSHCLEVLDVGDFSIPLARACLGQEMLVSAQVVFIWSGIFARSKWKYKQRAYRYVYLDCGHIAQNLALSVTSLGLGSCHIGAFYDDEINNLIGLDGKEESALYLSVIGYAI